MTAKIKATKKNKHLDEELFASYRKLPTLPFYQLVRQDPASLKKSQKQLLKDDSVPTFSYGRAKKFDADGYIEALSKWKSALTTDNELILSLYQQKADELLNRAKIVKAIQQNDRSAIGPLCTSLFGAPSCSMEMLKTELVHRMKTPPVSKDSLTSINAEQMKALVETVLAEYEMKGCSVAIKNVPSFRIKRGRSHHSHLIIPESFLSSKRRVIELLVHEIEVHLLRSENAHDSSLLILKQGLDHYLRTEEGLGMYFTRQAEERGVSRSPGFWNAYTILFAETHSFAETYQHLFEAKKTTYETGGYVDAETRAKESAWKLCVRAYRGVIDPTQPGPVFTRDHIYLSGFLDVQKFLETQKEDLGILFAGKSSINHIETLKKIGIKPAQTPKLVSKELVNRAFQNQATAN